MEIGILTTMDMPGIYTLSQAFFFTQILILCDYVSCSRIIRMCIFFATNRKSSKFAMKRIKYKS